MGEYAEVIAPILRIMRAVDHQDRELFTDCWTEDLDFEVVLFGQEPMSIRSRDELVSRFTADWNGQPAKSRHIVGAIEVEPLDERRARARFYCSYVLTGDPVKLKGIGEYEDELIKGADGRWRVARRRHRFLTPVAVA